MGFLGHGARIEYRQIAQDLTGIVQQRDAQIAAGVITSYSIHYTKLYDSDLAEKYERKISAIKVNDYTI